jgi:hypothetical protein
MTGCYNYIPSKAIEFRKGETADTLFVPKKALRINHETENPYSNDYYILQKYISVSVIKRYNEEYEKSKKYPVEFITVIGDKDSIHYKFNSFDEYSKNISIIKTYLNDQAVEVEIVTKEFSVWKTTILTTWLALSFIGAIGIITVPHYAPPPPIN